MIEQFHFLRPGWLLLLLPLALLLWRLLRLRHGGAGWRGVVDPGLLPHLLAGDDRPLRDLGRGLPALAALLGIVALAGPTWERLPQPTFHDERALVIALDLSRSMDAADVRPSRLVRARHKVADLLAARRGGQSALVVYAGDAFAVTPLTDDVDTILALLPALETGLMPAQGTRGGRALAQARELLANAGVGSGDILLITDGLDDEAMPAIDELKSQTPGLRLSVLAIGTADGGPIPLARGGFLKDDDGAIVIATLEAAPLREAARRGGGVYAPLTADNRDVDAILALAGEPAAAAAGRRSDLSADLWRELGPGLLLLALPLAALAFRRGVLLLLPLALLIQPGDAEALDWASLWRNDDQRAAELFAAGRHDEAAAVFADPAWRAAARYRAGDYERALEELDPLRGDEALYNRGTTLARLGRYDEALEAYARLLERNPGHADGAHNKQAIEDWLRREQTPRQQGSQAEQSRESGSEPQDDDRQGPGQPGETGRMPQEAEPGEDMQAAVAEREEQLSEQAAKQWLRRIPDDPGGLLRRKFRHQYRQRGNLWEQEQGW